MATAHLVHGYLGAGKTSFAARLEPVVRGIRLSADEWYLRLYAGDAPTGHLEQASWDRLSTLLNELWPRLLAHAVDVILDFGFWTRHSRDEARALARAAGAEAKLYVVVCADDVAKARCLPGRYEDSVLPSGMPVGEPQEAFDRACGLYFSDPSPGHELLPGTTRLDDDAPAIHAIETYVGGHRRCFPRMCLIMPIEP